MKKILAVLICVALVMSFVGCNSDDGDSNNGSIGENIQNNKIDESEHVDISELSDDPAILTQNIDYFREAIKDYPIYEWLDSHDNEIRNYYIMERTSSLPNDATIVNSEEDILNKFGSMYGDLFTYVCIKSDVVIDFSKYSSADLSPDSGKATTLSNGVLVVGDGVTLTLENLETNDGKSYPFGASNIVLEPNANIIVENGFLDIDDVLYISQGATVTINTSSIRANAFMNYGTLNLNNKDEIVGGLESIIYCDSARYIPLIPSFFNASSGNININNASLNVGCCDGEFYSDESYGQAAFYSSYPTQANYGNITTTGDARIKFEVTTGEASLQIPFIQKGVISVESDCLSYDGGLSLYNVHFQNFGDITISAGENYSKSQNPLVNEFNSLVENYGNFTFNAQSGRAIYLNQGNWINYEGAIVTDNIADTAMTIDKVDGFYFADISAPTENQPQISSEYEFYGIDNAESFMTDFTNDVTDMVDPQFLEDIVGEYIEIMQCVDYISMKIQEDGTIIVDDNGKSYTTNIYGFEIINNTIENITWAVSDNSEYVGDIYFDLNNNQIVVNNTYWFSKS